MIDKMTVLITGAAGFIGFHLAERLLKSNCRVVGVDNLSDYYDVDLKRSRLNILKNHTDFVLVEGGIEVKDLLSSVYSKYKPDYVVHLAAQAGVRYSIDNPRVYFESNLLGTFELLEASKNYPPKHVLLASTSSVYGANTAMPYNECHKADNQMSFYAATKKSAEMMSHSYSHIYGTPITNFRFFTVYGAWGRPDMALFKFTKAILEDRPIDVYNYGNMRRDFTFVDDLTISIEKLLPVIPNSDVKVSDEDSISPVAPWRVVNIGNSESINLNDFICAIEKALGKKAIRNLLPIQPGDVPATWADASLLKSLTSYTPNTNIYDGVKEFVEWYKYYYKSVS